LLNVHVQSPPRWNRRAQLHGGSTTSGEISTKTVDNGDAVWRHAKRASRGDRIA